MRIETALCLAVCDAVLGLPQQDVAPLFAYGPGQKASLWAEKAQIDPEAGAFAHQDSLSQVTPSGRVSATVTV